MRRTRKKKCMDEREATPPQPQHRWFHYTPHGILPESPHFRFAQVAPLLDPERERQKNIEANLVKLSEIGLTPAVHPWRKRKRNASTRVGNKKHRPINSSSTRIEWEDTGKSPPPMRSSGRLKGLPPTWFTSSVSLTSTTTTTAPTIETTTTTSTTLSVEPTGSREAPRLIGGRLRPRARAAVADYDWQAESDVGDAGGDAREKIDEDDEYVEEGNNEEGEEEEDEEEEEEEIKIVRTTRSSTRAKQQQRTSSPASLVRYEEYLVDGGEEEEEEEGVGMGYVQRPKIYKQEVYTTADLAKLGSCETEYPDVYAEKDQGGPDKQGCTTCHQCKQKTRDRKTRCSQCASTSLRGQLCGPCLQIRYGENLNEVLENPSWVCPVCRDICNCSLCREKKGWAPTGVMGPFKLKQRGFASVAHFLIQTLQKDKLRQEELDSSEDEGDVVERRRLSYDGEGKGKSGTGDDESEEEDEEEGSAVHKEEAEEEEEEEEEEKEDEKRRVRKKRKHEEKEKENEKEKEKEKTTKTSSKKKSEKDEKYKNIKFNRGQLAACWADPAYGDSHEFWVAKVATNCYKRATKVRVQWFERQTSDPMLFNLTTMFDWIPAASIFRTGFEPKFSKIGKKRWRLEEDVAATYWGRVGERERREKEKEKKGVK